MRVGIIGLGSIAKKHIVVLRELDNSVCIYALRHSIESESYFGVTNIYSLSNLLLEKLDFIIVSSPTSEHYKVLCELAKYNIPLFIEKPLFDRLYQLPEVTCKTYVACNLRFLDCINYVKNNLNDKRINEVNVYCGSYLPNWRPNTEWRESYSANKDMGGGVHIDLIHEVDYLYWLFGKPLNVNKHFKSRSSLSIDAIDYANYLMDYDIFTVSVVLNYYRKDAKRSLEIVFDDCTWSIDLLKNKVVDSDGRILFASNQLMVDTYHKQMSHFVDNINSDVDFNNIYEANEILKICIK